MAATPLELPRSSTQHDVPSTSSPPLAQNVSEPEGNIGGILIAIGFVHDFTQRMYELFMANMPDDPRNPGNKMKLNLDLVVMFTMMERHVKVLQSSKGQFVSPV